MSNRKVKVCEPKRNFLCRAQKIASDLVQTKQVQVRQMALDKVSTMLKVEAEVEE